ncbi:MAG: tetratricopeptide repeat protein [Marinilabiliales bacterium]|nr:MAG: tetratricopeptide repeat protein [Marinilabiliales bacterium]
MAKKNQEVSGDQRLETIEESLSKTEGFIVENQNVISIVVGVVVVVILAYFGFQRYYMDPQNLEAQEQMFNAQRFFEADSLEKALQGDGNSMGFVQIAEDYSLTKAGNLANYYAGLCYLKKGNFDLAIDYLDNFKSSDHIVGSMASGALGDAYLENGDVSSAISYYLEAAHRDKNEFTTPLFLLKAGNTYELDKNYSDAIKVYEEIKNEFPLSNEARDIDKYIARAKGLNK